MTPDVGADVVLAEFSRDGAVDLRPSVYVLDADPDAIGALVVRIHAEHTASFLRPPNVAAGVDFDGVGEPHLEPSPGETRFRFANERHHELLLDDENALRKLIDAVRETIDGRVHSVSLAQMLDHIIEQRAEPEWRETSAWTTCGPS